MLALFGAIISGMGTCSLRRRSGSNNRAVMISSLSLLYVTNLLTTFCVVRVVGPVAFQIVRIAYFTGSESD